MDEGITRPLEHKKYGKTFEEQCSFYLSIGMTATEYWNGDSDLPKYYREAHKKRQENANHEAWLNGLYFYDALTSAMSHLNQNKSLHKDYAAQPYSFSDKKTEKEKKIEAEAQAEVWMKSWVAATQKMFDKK